MALLDLAAAKAAEQPAPVARYRYARERSIYNRRVDTTIETWVDRDWHGRQRSVALREPGVSPRPQTRPAAEAFDGTPPRLSGLPTEPRALRDELLRRWREDTAPGLAAPEREVLERDHLIHEILILLTVPNATPALRSALWGVLKLMPGVERAPDAHDPLGRDGEAVRIRVAALRPGRRHARPGAHDRAVRLRRRGRSATLSRPFCPLSGSGLGCLAELPEGCRCEGAVAAAASEEPRT